MSNFAVFLTFGLLCEEKAPFAQKEAFTRIYIYKERVCACTCVRIYYSLNAKPTKYVRGVEGP